ncbi:MAG: glycogen/starch synthase [bacterium]
MRVVFVSSEVAPFAKTGGLADVSSALPRALAKKGLKISVFMPLYKVIKKRDFLIRKKKNLSVNLKSVPLDFGVFHTESDGVDFYFIERDQMFARSGIYGTAKGDFADNAQRFIFFQKAVLAAVRNLGIKPDVFHLNDWQTALIPEFAAEEGVPAVLTVHNLAYQGIYKSKFASYAGLEGKRVLLNGRFNFLYSGLVAADAITTVSPSYAEEVKTKRFGFGLDFLLRKRDACLKGILNGIDYSEWNPASDGMLAEKYDAENPGGKIKCKRELQRRLGLPASDSMLVAFISRLAEQKGVDIIIPALPEILKSNVQVAVLATGDDIYRRKLQAVKKKFPSGISLNLCFNNVLSHRIYAGSDVFLMPSLYEPCGLGSMIAFSYGSVPVVNPVGGLKDAVSPYNPSAGKGTGFFMRNYSSASLVSSVRSAQACWLMKQKWAHLVKRIMRLSFSWDKSAEEYIKLYGKLIRKKKRGRNA